MVRRRPRPKRPDVNLVKVDSPDDPAPEALDEDISLVGTDSPDDAELYPPHGPEKGSKKKK